MFLNNPEAIAYSSDSRKVLSSKQKSIARKITVRLAMIFTTDLITTNTEPLIPCQSSHFGTLANCCSLNTSMAYGFSDHHNRKRKKHAIFSFQILRQTPICFLHCYEKRSRGHPSMNQPVAKGCHGYPSQR